MDAGHTLLFMSFVVCCFLSDSKYWIFNLSIAPSNQKSWQDIKHEKANKPSISFAFYFFASDVNSWCYLKQMMSTGDCNGELMQSSIHEGLRLWRKYGQRSVKSLCKEPYWKLNWTPAIIDDITTWYHYISEGLLLETVANHCNPQLHPQMPLKGLQYKNKRCVNLVQR